MYERQFGLRENPFAAGHQSKYVYPSREHQEALAHLRFGIENREPFVLITGEVGTGKTTALYDALSEWKSRAVVALITNSALTRSELYEEICMRFGVPLSGPVSKPQLINQLERHLLVVRARGDFAILLIDEAQNLDDGLLEETRLLSNLEAQGQKLLQIFLVGQPELEDKLAQPALRQLRQRIAVHYRLRPLSVDDTTHYIHHRLSVAGGNAPQIFPADACAEVHAVTHGIPREINTVAAQALLNAFVEDAPSVLPVHVRAIVHDTGFQSVLDAPAAPPTASVPTPAAPPDAPHAVPPAPSAPAAPAPPQASSPSAASPVPVSDAPASTREVRHVPAPAPAPPRGGDTPTQPNQAEGLTMTGVRPAGSAESWQSWMQSLAKQTEESVQSPETNEATPPSGAPSEGQKQVPAEMSEEDFTAVEQEAMNSQIGGDEPDDADEHDDGSEASSESEPATGIRHEFDPNESQSGRVAPWSAPKLTSPGESPAMAGAPDFESAPGFNWDAPAARRDEPSPASPRSEETMPPVGSPGTPARGAATPTPPTTPPAAPAGVTSPTDDFDTLEVRRVEPTPPTPPPTPAATPQSTRPRVAPIPPPSGPVAPALPMRLRERLEEAERAEAQQKNGLVGWLIGVAVLAAIVLGVFLTMRFRKEHATPATTPTSAAAPVTPPATSTPAVGTSPPASEPAATTEGHTTPLAAPPAAVAPKTAPPVATRPASEPVKSAATTAAPPPTAASVPKPKPATSPTTAKSPPAATATKAAATTATKAATTTAAAVKPAATRARFGVSVGSFLAEDRAKSESDRLGAATGLPARVVTSKDGDFLVVLGAFSDRTAAEKAAGNLINGGKVEEARVVPLGTSH